MGRYRAPQKPGSPYITAQGILVLRQELSYLWDTKRPEVTKRVSAAAAEGDRSENAEYIYGKKQLREIDRRIRFLQKRLDVLKVVERVPDDQSVIYFAAWVTLEDEAGKVVKYRIVGADEFDLKKGYISMDAPLAKALIGKRQGDEISVQLPEGQKIYDVVLVTYS
jgi:transcription elongation factor GreB